MPNKVRLHQHSQQVILGTKLQILEGFAHFLNFIGTVIFNSQGAGNHNHLYVIKKKIPLLTLFPF